VGRDVEYEIAPFLQHAGLGMLVWSPLAGGFLSGKYTRENLSSSNGRMAYLDTLFLSVDRETGYIAIDKLREIATAHGEATPAQVALAWLLAKPYVTSVIIGASNLQQFSDNVAAINLTLTQEEVEALDALTTPKSLYPYNIAAYNGTATRLQALRG
jgi:aryl-alcohol dehydrogenase-like predicted oxidoreductase